jgi:hypothetical protein
MTKEKKEKEGEDIVVEEIQEEKSSFKKKTKDKKLSELEKCKKERQEYLDG